MIIDPVFTFSNKSGFISAIPFCPISPTKKIKFKKELLTSSNLDISILSKLDKLEFINRILKVGKTFYQKETNELPAGWQQKKLGDVCEILDSKRKKPSQHQRAMAKLPPTKLQQPKEKLATEKIERLY